MLAQEPRRVHLRPAGARAASARRRSRSRGARPRPRSSTSRKHAGAARDLLRRRLRRRPSREALTRARSGDRRSRLLGRRRGPGLPRRTTSSSSPGRGVAAAPDASDEAAVVMYTSGTTGKPKGAVRKLPEGRARRRRSRSSARRRSGIDERHLAICPLYHATAFGFTALSYLARRHGRACSPSSGPRPSSTRSSATASPRPRSVPTMLHRVLELGPDVHPRVRHVVASAVFSGGAPLSGASSRRRRWISSATSSTTSTAPPRPASSRSPRPQTCGAAPGTIGHVVPGNEIRLLDEAGRDVHDGQVGELYARNSMLVEGYHDDAERHERAPCATASSPSATSRADRAGATSSRAASAT